MIKLRRKTKHARRSATHFLKEMFFSFGKIKDTVHWVSRLKDLLEQTKAQIISYWSGTSAHSCHKQRGLKTPPWTSTALFHYNLINFHIHAAVLFAPRSIKRIILIWSQKSKHVPQAEHLRQKWVCCTINTNVKPTSVVYILSLPHSLNVLYLVGFSDRQFKHACKIHQPNECHRKEKSLFVILFLAPLHFSERVMS